MIYNLLCYILLKMHVERRKKNFITKSITTHGDKHDYSMVNYKNGTTPVDIRCKLHDVVFTITPNRHATSKVSSQGCDICYNAYNRVDNIKNKLSLDEIIERAKIKHNNFYIYDNTKMIDKKITIECPYHGEFIQNITDHITYGHGCKKCAKYKARQLYLDTTDIFITNAKNVHGNLYDYSMVDYIDSHTKVKIICTIHGIFEQVPNSHLQGSTCFFCAKEKIANIHRSCTEEFIEKAKIVHKDKYDYTETVYIGNNEKVIIICKKHGKFEQVPSSHLSGNGCYKCTCCGFSKEACEWLDIVAKENNIYIQHALNDGEYKIQGAGKVDGYCKETNTVYEFFGTYVHGDPRIYDADDYNKLVKKSMGELYEKTIKKNELIRSLGYNLVEMWEYDYLLIYKNKTMKSRKKLP